MAGNSTQMIINKYNHKTHKKLTENFDMITFVAVADV